MDVFQRHSVHMMNEVKVLKSVQHVSIKCCWFFLKISVYFTFCILLVLFYKLIPAI